MTLSKQYDFKAIEKDVSELWSTLDIVKKTTALDESKPLYSFLEGPPTANAPPGLHHVQSRFFKDLVCRFHYMKGFSVPRKGGWDCHGLPVEVQVEKKLGLKTKKDVIAYGIDKFNKLCREDIFTFINDWNSLTDRMAFWIDLDNAYITLKNEYIESVWWSLKELYNKDLLYEGHKVVPYCPRCETPLSSHEVALGYQDVVDPAITTMFKLKESDRYLLAWTTTPWTTPSNVALAVGEDILYVVVEKDGKQYILAKDTVKKYFDNPVILEEMNGADLVGKEYVPLFNYFHGKLDKPAWHVVAAEYVVTDEGTGIVHQAPAFGEDDYETVKKNKLAFVQPVDESGKFTADVSDFEGQFVKDADAAIVEQLEKDGLLFKKEQYEHSYPFCWRCSTPLLYYALDSWFVRVTAYKDKLLDNNEKIAWYPDNIREGRFGDWLRNVKDWALSRNKFWGTPLPIWKCAHCKKETIIGSISELDEAVGGLAQNFDLHKPSVDELLIKCTCGMSMKRVPYVIDTWYDSGSASFAQLHYPFENKELFEKLFPYSFITEGVDQTRGWFYTLHVLGTLLFDSPAYKSCVVSGLVIDENGEKMSKSKGNILNPFDTFDKVGVDQVRLQFSSVSADNAKRFGYELIRENVTPFITTLWNIAKFAESYLHSAEDATSELKLEDKWIISRTNTLIKTISEEFDKNNYHVCFELFKQFVIDDVSRWYIRLVRDRTDDAVQFTLKYVMSTLTKLLAPYAPYLSEHLYQQLTKGKEESVHLTSWPTVEQRDEQLEMRMEHVRSVVQSILSLRERIQRGVRWPIKEAVIVTSSKDTHEAVEAMSELIKDQANVKLVKVQHEFAEAKKKLKADYSKLGPKYGKDTPAIIAHLSMRGQNDIITALEEKGSATFSVNDTEVTLDADDVTISLELPDQYEYENFSGGVVFIDKDVTREMEAEGMMREVTRLIQQSRKDTGLTKDQPIRLVITLPSDLLSLIQSYTSVISEKVNATIAMSTEENDGTFEHVVKHSLKNKDITLQFSKT